MKPMTEKPKEKMTNAEIVKAVITVIGAGFMIYFGIKIAMGL